VNESFPVGRQDVLPAIKGRGDEVKALPSDNGRELVCHHDHPAATSFRSPRTSNTAAPG